MQSAFHSDKYCSSSQNFSGLITFVILKLAITPVNIPARSFYFDIAVFLPILLKFS